jgi:hypothetical protein
MEFINDADYKVSLYETTDGKCKQVWTCPIYDKWAQMKIRTTSVKYQSCRPTYSGSMVHEEWKYFSNFKKWIDSHPVGEYISVLELDKDLKTDLHMYSPDTCLLIPVYINNAYRISAGSRGIYPLGVSKDRNLYKTSIRMFGVLKNLGRYKTTNEAHKAWQLGKIQYTDLIIDKYKNEPFFYQDVVDALHNIKNKLAYDYANNIETTNL